MIELLAKIIFAPLLLYGWLLLKITCNEVISASIMTLTFLPFAYVIVLAIYKKKNH